MIQRVSTAAAAKCAAGLLACLLLAAVPSYAAKTVRDEWGGPHITAESLPDLFYALGYATAEDRLVQLDLTRRKTYGQLSTVGGREYLAEDIGLRQLNLHALAERELVTLQSADPAAYEALCAYARGITEGAASCPPPPEYLFLPPFAEWSPVDTLALGKLMHLYMSGDRYDEMNRYRARQRGEEWSRMLDACDHAVAARGWTPVVGEPWQQLGLGAATAGAGSPALGSNAFVVAGKFTANGRPILACDPHLELTFPSIWYEAELTLAGGFSVRGIMLPGTPLIAMGMNEHYAWGITSLQADNEDLLVVPKHLAAEVLGTKPAERRETFCIREGLKVVEESAVILDTPLGPVIEEDGENYFILHWSGFYESSDALGFYALNRGSSLADFRSALARLSTPFNFVYADAEGNIAYFAAGAIPLRGYDGSEPRTVTTAEQASQYRWRFIPSAELPQVVNPPEGFIVSCNNPPALTLEGAPAFPGNYAPGYRARRLSELLAAGQARPHPLEFADLGAMQRDVHSGYAAELLPSLLARLEALSGSFTADELRLLEALAAWNLEEAADSIGAPIYELLRLELVAVLRSHHFVATHSDVALQEAMAGAEWVNLSQEELLQAWRGMVSKLRAGERSGLLAYGEMHRLPLVSPLPLFAEKSPGLLPDGGGFRTVNVSAVQWDGKHLLKSFAPTARLIMCPGTGGGYWSVLPGGNSGRADSLHYADQVGLYLSGHYKYQPAG